MIEGVLEISPAMQALPEERIAEIGPVAPCDTAEGRALLVRGRQHDRISFASGATNAPEKQAIRSRYGS